MRKMFAILPVILLSFSLNVHSQDFSRLGRLADEIKDQAGDLARTTERSLDKNRQNSAASIEGAFLADQVAAGSKLLEKIIKDRFDIGDIRLSANVLSEMSERFPLEGQHGARWARLKDKISEMMFELRRGASANVIPAVEDADEIDESRILGRFFWIGEIDAEVHLSVQGTRISSRTVGGRDLPAGAYSFTSALPETEDITVRVFKKDGRGEVTMIQQPSADNGHTAIVRIWDGDGGADTYSLEIFWYQK